MPDISWDQFVKRLLCDSGNPSQVCADHGISCETALRWVLQHVTAINAIDYGSDLPYRHLEDYFDYELLYRIDRLPGGSAFLADVDDAYSALLRRDESRQDCERTRKELGAGPVSHRADALAESIDSRKRKQAFIQVIVDQLRRKTSWSDSDVVTNTIEICRELKAANQYTWPNIPSKGTLQNDYLNRSIDELCDDPHFVDTLPPYLQVPAQFAEEWLRKRGIPV